MNALLLVLLAQPAPDLESAVQLLKSEDYERAALAASEVQGDEARMVTGKALYRMGLYHSALTQYAAVLDTGPSSKHYTKALEWLVYISRKTQSSQSLGEKLAKAPEAQFPERYRAELYWLLARYHALEGQALDAKERPEARAEFAEARRLARMVPKNDPFAARARYLEAMADLRDEKLSDAVNGFKQVLRSTDGASDSSAKTTRELAMLQLGRTAYAQKEDRYAAAYYAKVPRGSKQWLDALFESAWAYYRLGDDEKALGNLLTLSSPFFKTEYYPEAYLVQAIVLYENCGFTEAHAVLDELDGIYGPVRLQLQSLLQADVDARALYQRLETSDGPIARISSLALSQPEVAGARVTIHELEAELDRVAKTSDAFRYSELAQTLEGSLKSRRDQLAVKAGTAARARLQLEQGELERLITDAMRIRFEVSEREKVRLEAQLKGRELKPDALVKYEFSREVNEDQAYWPVTSEYWRDELGTYLYTLTRGCAVHRTSGGSSAGSR